ncbi:MAG: hypothetical protein BGO98_29550 [Myxococcales bacterium 68-20]|nr:MAG: hypothetical protein BGO98_29550 [Myxococcales bacterium 68-20]
MALWSPEHVLRAEDNLSKVFNDDFQNARENTWHKDVCAERTGLGINEDLQMLQSSLTIEKLPNGTMVYADLKSIGHRLEHEDWGVGFKITRAQFHFDQFGKASEAAAQLGDLAALHPQVMTLQLIKDGATKGSYDKVPFWSADHPVNGVDNSNGVFSNNNTGSTLSPETFAVRVAAMESRVMINGISRNLRVTHLLHSPELKKTALEVTGAKFLGAASGGTNDNVLSSYGVKPLNVPGLAPKEWILVAQTSGPMGRPFIYSRAIDFGLNSYDGVTQAELNRLNELEYQLRGLVAAQYSHPYLVDRNVGA